MKQETYGRLYDGEPFVLIEAGELTIKIGLTTWHNLDFNAFCKLRAEVEGSLWGDLKDAP